LFAKAGQQQRHPRRDGAEDERTQEGLGKERGHG
jgi:hypothetical protein